MVTVQQFQCFQVLKCFRFESVSFSFSGSFSFRLLQWFPFLSVSGLVDLHWLTADLLILIWIRTIAEITAPSWSKARNRRWISLDLTCLEQSGMSWINMEWSAGWTTVPTGSTLSTQMSVLSQRESPKLNITLTTRTRSHVLVWIHATHWMLCLKLFQPLVELIKHFWTFEH